MSSAVISTHLLCIENDHAFVFKSVRCLSAKWRMIGLYLGVTYYSMEAIEENRKEVDDKLMDLIAVWLRRESEDQPKPTWKKLCDAVSAIDRTKAETIAQEHLCDCSACFAGNRKTRVAKEVESRNVVGAARALKEEFEELMLFAAKEIRLADAVELRLRINMYVKNERKVNEVVETHLSRIEDYIAAPAILNYLYRHEFIGYINYALLKVIQKVIKSKLLDKHIEEYEKDYQLFLQCALKDIHDAFKKCPDLQPNYPVGLPSFTIHLESEWDGRSMYEWTELFERRFSWPETLNIVKISENCIIITCTVWPRLAEEVAKDLTDPEIIANLKKEGVTIDISPQLLAYHPAQCVFQTTTAQEVFGSLEEQLRIDQLMKDELAGGILAIKPDWDRQTGTSGYDTKPDSSDKQTVTSGDDEDHRLVELQEDITLEETIRTYERVLRERKKAYECLMMKVLKEKDSIEKEFLMETKMKKCAVIELEQIKASSKLTPSQLQAALTEREEENELLRKEVEKLKEGTNQYEEDQSKFLQIKRVLNAREEVIGTMKEDIRRLQQSVKDLTVKPRLSDKKQRDLDNQLLTAAENGDMRNVEILLTSGASTDCTTNDEYLVDLIGKNYKKRTPIHYASQHGHQDVVQLLLNHGAVVDAKDIIDRTPLHYASENGRQEVVQLLINHGATVDAKNKTGWTPLHLASQNGRQEVVELLINHGATVDAKNYIDRTPLHYASENGRQEVVQLLINHGATVDAKDITDWTPLHFASQNGRQEVVQLLINHGATVDAKDKTPGNWTPLHLASENGRQEVVQLLINHGATVDAKSPSPLHLALLSKHPDVAVLLISSGADINMEDKLGQSPVLIATVLNYEEVLKLFQSQGVSAYTLQKYHLPPGWKAEVEGCTNRIEYINSKTGVKQYHHPNLLRAFFNFNH